MRGRALLLLATLLPGGLTAATRVKELVSVEGMRDNPLIGYGLVVGLNGTGDRRQTMFSAQTLANMLQQMGVRVPASSLRVQNTAAVMVTTNLPAYSRPGTKLDVTVAAVGDATSLQGGLLLMTSLRAVDGQVYSIAQGPLIVGGFTASQLGSSQTMNHPTTARIPNGAVIEQASPMTASKNELVLELHRPDVTTAIRIAEAVNRKYGAGGAPVAVAEDAGLVRVALPGSHRGRALEFLSEVERLTVETDHTLKVVINERTGTIVLGQELRIAPVTIVHGSLTVEITTDFEASQPNPMSRGTTTVVPRATVRANERPAQNVMLKDGATVEELVRQLNAIGVTSREVIAILENLRTAGALDAEIEVI